MVSTRIYDIIDFSLCNNAKHIVLKKGYGYFTIDADPVRQTFSLRGLRGTQEGPEEFEGKILGSTLRGNDPEDGYLWERATLKYLVRGDNGKYYNVIVELGQGTAKVICTTPPKGVEPNITRTGTGTLNFEFPKFPKGRNDLGFTKSPGCGCKRK